MHLSGKQVGAAIALAGWERKDLQEKAGISIPTIRNIINEKHSPQKETLEKIIATFDEAGIEFTENQGVRYKPQNMEVLEGEAGFARFYDFVYDYLRQNGGSVCISGVREELFIKHHGKHAPEHQKRMTKLLDQRNDIAMRVLIEEGDTNFASSSYAKYRWQPKEYFSPSAFYVFGENLALITFAHDPAPLVFLIKSASLAGAYLQAFDLAWDQSVIPTQDGHEIK